MFVDCDRRLLICMPKEKENHEQRATQDRAEAHWNRQEAQRRAAVGDYRGAAEADRDARQN